MSEQSRTLWIWLGGGCLATIGLAILAIVGTIGFVGVRTAARMADPATTLGEALEVLSARTIPAGYSTQVVMDIPLFSDFVVLEAEQRQIVFLTGLNSRADLGALFGDDSRIEDELHQAGVRLRRDQSLLTRERLRIGDADVLLALVEGEVDFDADADAAGFSIFDFDPATLGDDDNPATVEAQLGAIFLVRCSENDPPGLGLWRGPHAEPADDTAASRLEADRAALVGLLEQFGFCES